MGGLLSFLASTAFRWLFGSLLEAWTKGQDHRHEVELLGLQLQQDAQRHQWQQEAIQAQAAAGVRVIEAQSVQAREQAADAAFLAAVSGVNAASERAGWVGGWNAAIRPALATVAILLIAGSAIAPDRVVLTGVVLEVVCAVLGVFIGGRIASTGR
jgi:hypothetical protein